MKFSTQRTFFPKLVTVTLLAGVWNILPMELQAAEPDGTTSALNGQKSFASPDDAVAALHAAAEAKDQSALQDIFGPEFKHLSTGDTVQDANNAQHFAMVMAQGCRQVKESDDTITLEVGTNDWPMPIPLVKADGQWHFDTAAGQEEIINRHIGKDEIKAISVCRAYVTAQRQFAGMNQNADGGPRYALKFKSSSGKKDGLYWPSADGESGSPFGPLVAESHVEGFSHGNSTGLHAFHGYFFRILTRQGEAAPGGKMNYLTDGNLTKGFALVAYPEKWDKSGVMTFIVNQDGKVFQRSLGEKTAKIAGSMKEYNPNPDDGWTLVEDQGELDAVSEK